MQTVTTIRDARGPRQQPLTMLYHAMPPDPPATIMSVLNKLNDAAQNN
jgi:hypothetical protein